MNVDFFEKFSIEYETRTSSLSQQEKTLHIKVEEQNQRFNKLQKGYDKLGLNTLLQGSEPLLQNSFIERLNKEEENYNSLMNSTLSSDKFEVQKITEQYISNLISLFSYRWNSINAFRNLWSNELSDLRKKEFVFIENEYVKLEKKITNLSQEKFLSQTENIFKKHLTLIQEQKKYLSALEQQMKELEELFYKREELYNLAVKMFEM